MIIKGQLGLVTESDNTRVAKPIIQEKIQYKLKPGEFFYTNRSTGEKIPVRPKSEAVSPDTRSAYQKQQDQIKAQQLRKQYEEEKKQEEGMKNFQGLLTFVAPSTYIGPIFNNNGKSYAENVMSGEGTGNVVDNITIDLLTPLSVNKFSKVIQTAPKTVAKIGNNYARSKIISRGLNQQIKNFDGTVSENYFNSPYNWYRITESPEVYGIKEMGKNVTTIDAADMYIPSNKFRLSVIDNKLTSRDGYWYKPLKSRFNFSKRGSAHGNTSQAAKGHLWQGTTAGSSRFPITILEGDMPIQTYRGFNPVTGLDSRTSFHLVDSETIPMGARIGFHTGEMPIEGLRSFTRLSNGKYRYDGPVIPYKIIQVNK